MAKRKEVVLQETINTPQLWDDAMAKEKLFVIDVYQKWCGPCKAIIGMLKRIKNELGDDYLSFAIAEADSIPSLEQYRGHCEPMFLFFGCGQLVAYVRGCDAPLIQKTIVDTLKHEHKVLEGEAERKPIQSMQDSETPEEDEEQGGEEEGEITVAKQITVALIKPDVVSNGQVDEILEKIKEAGIEVLTNEERLMTEDEAKAFYQNKSEEEYFDELIAYVTSGPCHVLVLTKGGTGEGVVEQWRDIIGPFDAAVAKESSPDSLRAVYGTDAKANALHGSSSQEEAARELAFFFPEYSPPVYRATSAVPSARSKASARSRKSAKTPIKLQRTLAIVRPDALKKHKDAIMEKIQEAGFEISMTKEMQLTEEQAKAFYKEHEDKEYFQALVDQMTSGPVLALCLAHNEAVQKWRDMLGPKVPAEAVEQEPDSLRAQFHVEEAAVNMIHGSDSVETAQEELKSIFKVEQTLAVIKPDAISQIDDIKQKLKEAGFMISCQKDMNLSREIAGEIYKSKEGAEFYDSLIDHMTSGPTMMMVLSAEDAVEKLRNLMGPTDPEQAKETAPDSLRALFAKSVMENAIHSPSTPESAKERLKVIFGDVEFDWDGTVTGGVVDEPSVDAEDAGEQEGVAADQENPEEDSADAEKVEEEAAAPAEEEAAAPAEEEAAAPTEEEAEQEETADNAEETEEMEPTENTEAAKEELVENTGEAAAEEAETVVRKVSSSSDSSESSEGDTADKQGEKGGVDDVPGAENANEVGAASSRTTESETRDAAGEESVAENGEDGSANQIKPVSADADVVHQTSEIDEGAGTESRPDSFGTENPSQTQEDVSRPASKTSTRSHKSTCGEKSVSRPSSKAENGGAEKPAGEPDTTVKDDKPSDDKNST